MSSSTAQPTDAAATASVAPYHPKYRDLANNIISLAGLMLAALSLMFILTFFLFIAFLAPGNPYVDIIGYLVLPGIFVVGLLIVPAGMIWKFRRLRRHPMAQAAVSRLLRIDLADRRTRGGLLIFLGITFFVVLPVLAVTSYEGYHFTESTTFCGQACHSVMEPEATAHANSPHARVTCAECHIGTGADWFVKAKLSGTRQVIAVWRNTYPRPIPPAISQLRPARETCEECHWPAKFFGAQLKEIVHYSSDEQNTRHIVRLLLKTGGADESIGRIEGIHMHMIQSGRIEYMATDPGLQDIPWVRYITSGGVETVYRADGLPHDAPPPPGVVRRVDCMDCHNRGAHHFRSPQTAVDLYLEANRIDRTLPYIKHQAVAALVRGYPDYAAADQGIEDALVGFYQQQRPDVWKTREAAVRHAAAMVRDLYRQNFFPSMRVDWRTYPENIGHLTSPGCFRCHDGLHVDPQGRAISTNCEGCHTFLNAPDSESTLYIEGEFQHSMQLLFHGKLRCTQCHNGGELPSCRDCHGTGQWLEQAGQGQFRPEGK